MRTIVASTGVLATLVTLVSGVGLVLAAPGPAESAAVDTAEPSIGLSRDGRAWGDRLTQPLFADSLRWVPGDQRTARVWVRNQSVGAADLTVAISSDRTASQIEDQALRVLVRAGTGAWQSVSAGSTSGLAVGEELAGGRALPVDLRVRMREDAPNSSMTLDAGLDFVLRLSDSEVVAGASGTGDDSAPPSTTGSPGPDGSTGPDAALPPTGSLLPPWAPWAAGIAVGLGLLLLVRSRRGSSGIEPTRS